MIIKTSMYTARTADNSIDVPLQNPYHAPVGTFHAIVREARKGGSGRPTVRFTFGLNVPGSSTEYRANLELVESMNSGSDLWHLLCKLVGRKAVQECKGGKFDLNTLVGLQCAVETGHIYNDEAEHDFPFVVVRDVQEAGSLVTSTGNCKASIKK
jgi:hypothetical protein